MVKRKSIRTKYGVPYMHSSGSSSYQSSRSGLKRRKTIVLAADSQPPSQPTFAERAVSSAIGFAAGNVPGAIYGAVSPFVKFSQKNMANTRTKVTKSLVNRSAMAKTGKTTVKKEKKVKVSPYLRKAIKQVSAGDSATGFYQRIIGGMVGSIITAGGNDFQVLQDTYTVDGMVAAFYGNTTTASDLKTWFGTLFNQNFSLQAGAGSPPVVDQVAATPRQDQDLNFFTPCKIWHAASVLFNNKTEERSPYNNRDQNLNTVFNPTSGAITTTQPGMLKLHVLHSKVDFVFKNLSNRILEVDVYECVSTQKFNARTPLDDLFNVSTVISDNGTEDKLIGYYSGGSNLVGTNTSIIREGTVDAPAIFKGKGWHWNYVKRTMVLNPYELCTHTMSGPSGVLDFGKLLDQMNQQSTPNVYRVAGALKNWSKHVMISVRVDPVSVVGAIPTASSQAYAVSGQRLINYLGVNGALHSPLAVEAIESFRIKVPEVAGFTERATVVGQKQQLQHRKNKIQITNLLDDNAITTNMRIITANEENPTALTTALTGAIPS